MNRRNFTADRRICEAVGDAVVWRVDGGSVMYFDYENGEWYPLFYGEIDKTDAAFIAEARTGWPAALDEIERLRDVLERMDDRIGPMMPRSVMAHMAREALDFGKEA